LATAKIDAGKDRTIVIQNEEGTYTLRAESEEEMQEWVIALRQSRIGSDSLNENYLRFLNVHPPTTQYDPTYKRLP